MVRRGSTVRVRQRASRKRLQRPSILCLVRKRLSRAGTRRLLLAFPRRRTCFPEFGLLKRLRTHPRLGLSPTRNEQKLSAAADGRSLGDLRTFLNVADPDALEDQHLETVTVNKDYDFS